MAVGRELEQQMKVIDRKTSGASYFVYPMKVAEDMKNIEDDATPEIKLSEVNADKQLVDDHSSADKVALKPEDDDLDAKKSPRLESKPERAAKKKVKKSNISISVSDSSDTTHVADEKKVGGRPDQEKDKEKASEITEYNENIVGKKIDVYFARDQEWNKGTIESYHDVCCKHTIKYCDGVKETVNLAHQHWKFIEDPVSCAVQASEPADQDGASERPKKKKYIAPISEKSAKVGKTQESSSKGGFHSSSNSKAVGVPKSGNKSKDCK